MSKILYVFIMICLAMPVMAQEHNYLLQNVEKYINNLTTAQGDFKQLTSSGGYATGKFYLSRPGKMRMDYDAPNNIQLMADGDDLIYYDKDLVQVTYLGLDSSIAGVLVQDKFTFKNPDFKVEDVIMIEDTIRVAVSSAKDIMGGKIILIFKKDPLELIKWQIIDAQGIATTILLENMKYGQKLDKNLFVFKDPRHSSEYLRNRRR